MEEITISKQEYETMKAHLADAEKYRDEMLQHSKNLEYALNKKEENITDFLEHIKNIEHLMAEKDKDLNQTKEVLSNLEARCYQYEQMLLEYGKKFD
jgi:chromosome segregation ATPase